MSNTHAPNAQMAAKEKFLLFELIRQTSLILKKHFFCSLSLLTRPMGLIRTRAKKKKNWPSFMHLVYDHCPKIYYVNIVYVTESAAYGVLFTICLSQNPNERGTSQQTTAKKNTRRVQSTFYVVSCLLHIRAFMDTWRIM